jgi:zinc transport system substrate-binding protein
VIVNQKRAALVAIAVVIPISILAIIFTSTGSSETAPVKDETTIVASFYPLYEFTRQVAGDKAKVSSLVPAGIEPHDWEPTAIDVQRASAADLVIINGAGFEAWAPRIGTSNIIDTSQGMELGETGTINPHIWLDPVLAKQQVEEIRSALVRVDPDNGDYYNANAAKFSAELDSIDSMMASELVDCSKTDFIAFHDAFAHFAKRYGLIQHSIHGVSPEGEILPQRVEEVITLANELGIDVIYAEELVDSRLAETIAEEIPDGRVLVLSPIEGIEESEQAQGIGYIEKMKENIANLKEGLGCT